MQIEHRVSVNASPERIFRIYKDVSAWNTWDPDTKSATIIGKFQAGSHGKLTPVIGNAVPILFTNVVEDKSITVESKIPFFRMVFEHELQSKGEVTNVIHRVTFSGLLSKVIAPVIAKRINVGLPVTLSNLKQLAES